LNFHFSNQEKEKQSISKHCRLKIYLLKKVIDFIVFFIKYEIYSKYDLYHLLFFCYVNQWFKHFKPSCKKASVTHNIGCFKMKTVTVKGY